MHTNGDNGLVVLGAGSQKYYVELNGYHVYVRSQSGELLYSRIPMMPEWRDASHRRITDALERLQKALDSALETN